MILVFGGKGQIGRELVRAAADRQVPLIALDRRQVNITDQAAVAASLRKHCPKLVINAAAYTNVERAELDRAAAAATNAEGPAILARACGREGVPLLHISTDYVFDGTKSGPYVEGDLPSPLNVYGWTKADGEAAVRGILVNHIILRTSWLYGVFGHNFLKTVVGLAMERDELRMVSDQLGSPTSTRELGAAVLRIAPRLVDAEEVWGTYHFAGAGTATWHEFASVIIAAQASLTGRSPKVIPITTAEYPTAAVRPSNSALDCSRFAHVFGFLSRSWTEDAADVTRAMVVSQQRFRARAT